MKDYTIRTPPQGEMRDPLPAETQFLGFVAASVCRECGLRVRWKVRSTYHAADGLHIVQYLRCPTPGCVGKATRLLEKPDAIG